jgi:hypothetical protein
MKIRNGFVSNSSSSSFLIKSELVSDKQLYKIRYHLEWGKLKGVGDYFNEGDRWEIDIGEKYIHGWTSMDNFNMSAFLEFIGINNEDIEWRD